MPFLAERVLWVVKGLESLVLLHVEPVPVQLIVVVHEVVN